MPRRPLSRPSSIPEKPHFTEFEGEDFWCVPGYTRNLPHWRLSGATYFITFRLSDSVPQEVAEHWQADERTWLLTHGIEPEWRQHQKRRFHTALLRVPLAERMTFERAQTRKFFTTLDKCHGCCLLRDPEACQIVANSLTYFHGQRLWTGDFVVMPNHVHVIAQMYEGVVLEEWLYSVKRFSATQMIQCDRLREKAVTRASHLWQTESFDRVIRDRAELKRTRDYIHQNPAKLGKGSFVYHRAEWLDHV